ncbi:hypothetical protein [Cohaesibacter celericrescens]|nr:hypothetical protein [Cohaesibacter celericrescens]
MNFFNRAFDRYIQSREEQAERFVSTYMADHGIDTMLEISTDSKD